MKIRIYSDLHLEFGKFRVPDADPDTVLILAGDIGVKLSAMSFIERVAPKFKAVIYIAGNHEFYGGNMNTVLSRWAAVDHIPNFYFLNDEKVVIDGVRFLGSTLWTDMNNDDSIVKQFCQVRMNDYKIISVGEESYSKRKTNKTFLSPSMTVCLHKQSMAFLEKELEASTEQTVVITHHSPTINGVNSERYDLDALTYSYYTPLESVMDRYGHLTHWVFGHTHKSLDIDIYGTRVLSNPRGYVGYEVNSEFDPSMELEI